MLKANAKAQVSAEFALLMLISLAAFAITAAFVISANKDYKNFIQHKMFLYDKNKIILRAEEICLSGSGSKRTIQLLTEIDDIEVKIICNVDIEKPLKGLIEILNEDGKVIIRNV